LVVDERESAAGDDEEDGDDDDEEDDDGGKERGEGLRVSEEVATCGVVERGGVDETV